MLTCNTYAYTHVLHVHSSAHRCICCTIKTLLVDRMPSTCAIIASLYVLISAHGNLTHLIAVLLHMWQIAGIMAENNCSTIAHIMYKHCAYICTH